MLGEQCGVLLLTAFLVTIGTPLSAHGQGAEARPPLRVRATASSGVAGLTPAQVRRSYGFDRISRFRISDTKDGLRSAAPVLPLRSGQD